MELNEVSVGTGEARKAYAAASRWGGRIAMVLLIVTFAVYVFGLLPARVPMTELREHWHQPAAEYLATYGLTGGWSWLHRLGYGDFLNFAPIAVLATVTMVALLRALLVYARLRDRLAMSICLVELVILLVAASGVLVH